LVRKSLKTMKEQIKTICLGILKIFGWMIFLLSLFLVLFKAIPDLYQYGTEGWKIEDWIILSILLVIIFSLGYIFRKTLLAPFRVFLNLTFERKMMLIVVLAILVAVGFYAWDIWEKQKYFERQKEGPTFEEMLGL